MILYLIWSYSETNQNIGLRVTASLLRVQGQFGVIRMYICMYVYFGTCLTMQNNETMNSGSEKEDM